MPKLMDRKLLFSSNKNYLIAFLNVLPGVKPGALRAARVIFSPVFGLRPVLAARDLTLNVPNPVKTTFSPLFNESRIVFKDVWTASLDALFVRLAFFATISIKSFFVIEKIHPPSFLYFKMRLGLQYNENVMLSRD